MYLHSYFTGLALYFSFIMPSFVGLFIFYLFILNQAFLEAQLFKILFSAEFLLALFFLVLVILFIINSNHWIAQYVKSGVVFFFLVLLVTGTLRCFLLLVLVFFLYFTTGLWFWFYLVFYAAYFGLFLVFSYLFVLYVFKYESDVNLRLFWVCFGCVYSFFVVLDLLRSGSLSALTLFGLLLFYLLYDLRSE